MNLYKDGITVEVLSTNDAARLKRLGYVEVKEPKQKEENPPKEADKKAVKNESARN